MCDKRAFRDPSIEPKTAEELFELAQKKQTDREKKSKTNGTKWQGDYLR